MKTTKRLLTILLTIFILTTMIPTTLASNTDIKVKLDGNLITFDTPPCLIGGRTMVPLRAIFEALGATVSWDDTSKTVTSYNEAYLVKCTIGRNEIHINDSVKIMDVAPMIIDGRTLVPARFIAEAFACNVDWDSENRTVNITSNPIDYSQLEKPSNNTQITPKPSDTKAPITTNNTTTGNTKGALKKPYSADDGAVIVYQEWSHYPQKQVSIKCTNVIRGNAANNLAYSENQFNDQPNSSQEWCFLEFDVKYISSTGSGEEVLEGSDIIYKDTFFDTSGTKLNVADMATLGDTYRGYGVFDTEFYPGGSGKVVIGILINKDVDDILLRVPNKSKNTNTWIKCADSSSKSISSTNISSSSVNSSSTKTPNNYYPGTTIPTYTSITGVTLKDTEYLSSGSPVYMYNYTSADDVGAFWDALSDNGWTNLKGDDKSTTDKFESSFYKGSDIIIVNIYFDFDEVWITY